MWNIWPTTLLSYWETVKTLSWVIIYIRNKAILVIYIAFNQPLRTQAVQAATCDSNQLQRIQPLKI